MKLVLPSGAILILLFTVGIFFLAVSRQACAIAPENVLVIYNGDQGPPGDGFQIADHYQQARPGVHIAPITGIDTILAGAFNEEVSAQDYLDIIRPQILSTIGAIPDTIDVIVTTKGLPLRINAGGGSFSSLESELVRIDSIDTIGEMTNQFFLAGFHQFDTNLSSNPYYFENAPFVRAGSDPINGDIRLASRLDGYSVKSVQDSIDRAQNVFLVPFRHKIIADDTGFPSVDQMTNSAGLGAGLFEVVTGLYPDDGITDPVPIMFDNTNNAITSSGRQVIGYVSHGTNDGGAVGLSNNYLGEFVGSQFQPGEVQFDLANGAVFLTHESFNAQSFDPLNTQNQGLIADWLEVGGTAGLGHVAEPTNGPDNVTNEDLFYEKFLPAGGAAAAPGMGGWTFVEAAWNATRQVSYVNTVVGDPLMQIQAWLPGDSNLDGAVDFYDFYTLDGNWLQPGDLDDGDFNGDGMVDGGDFALLQANWLYTVGGSPISASEIVVAPILDSETGWPKLSATITRDANLDLDIDVDGDDMALLMASYGIDAGGDIDGDGDTDGADFLLWQQQVFLYTYSADFNFDAQAGSEDFDLWAYSYGKNRGGDTDGDNDTDGFDFLAWQREASLPAAWVTSASTQVPEPCGMLLVFTGVLAFVFQRRAIRCCFPSVG